MPTDFKITKEQLTNNFSQSQNQSTNSRQQVANSEELEVIYSLEQSTCKDFVPPEEFLAPKPCSTCTPNPDALVPDWTTYEGDPFLNEKDCLYTVVIETKYNSTGGEDELVTRIKEYKRPAIKKLLRFYQKKETDLIVDLLENGTQGAPSPFKGIDYYVPPEESGRLKILYVIPAFNFDGIEQDYQTPEEETTTTPGPVNSSFIIKMSNISMMLSRFELVMRVYGKYQAKFHTLDDGRIYYGTSTREFIIGNEDSNKILTNVIDIKNGLNYILSRKKFNDINEFDIIPNNIAGFTLGDERKATELEFGVDQNYKINLVTIRQSNCPDITINNPEEIDELCNRAPLNNPTIVAYLSRIEEIHTDIIAREPIPWLDFIKKYTYPSLRIDYGKATLIDDDETLLECVVSAINDSVTNITNSVIEKVASFPDLFFDKYIQDIESCRTEEEEINFREKLRADLIKNSDKLNQQLAEKFFAEVDVLVDMKKRIKALKRKGLSIKSIYTSIINDYGYCGIFALLNQSLECIASGMSFGDYLKEMVRSSLKNLAPKDMAVLLKGLPLDKRAEISKKIQKTIDKLIEEGTTFPSDLESASKLKQERDENVAYSNAQKELDRDIELAKESAKDSYIKSQDKKANQQAQEAAEVVAEYEATVDNIEESQIQIEQNNIKTKEIEAQIAAKKEEVSNREQTLENLEESLEQTENKTSKSTIKEKIKVEEQQISKLNNEISELENQLYSIKQSTLSEEALLDLVENGPRPSKSGTIGKNGIGKQLGELQKLIFNAYADALMDILSIDQLLENLKRLPGADIVSRIINAKKVCAKPNSIATQPGWNDFFKTLELDYCRGNYSVTLPKFPKLPSFFSYLVQLFKKFSSLFLKILESTISKLFLSLIEKLLSFLTNGFCSLLNKVAQTAVGLAGGQSLQNILREAFGCDPLTPDEEINKAVQQIFGGLGAVPSVSSSNSETAERLMTAVSNSLNTFEMIDLLKGELDETKLSSLKRIIAADVPEYANSFSNESSISDVFSALGTLIPKDLINRLEEQARQAVSFNPAFGETSSICPTPERLEEFDNLRSSLLANKGLTNDQIKHQLEQLRKRNIENMQQVSNIVASSDIGSYLASQLPPLISDPASDSLCTPSGNNSSNQNGILPSTFPVVTEIMNETNEYIFNSLEQNFIKDVIDPPFLTFPLFDTENNAFFDNVLIDIGGNYYSSHYKRLNNFFATTFDNEGQKNYFLESRIYLTSENSMEETYLPETVANELKNTLATLEPLADANKNLVPTNSRDTYIESSLGKAPDLSINISNEKSSISFDVLCNMHIGSTVADTFIPNYKDYSKVLVVRKRINSRLELELSPLNFLDFQSNGANVVFDGNGEKFKNIEYIFNVEHSYDQDVIQAKNNFFINGYEHSPQSAVFNQYINNSIFNSNASNIQEFSEFSKKQSFDIITKELQKFILRDITFENEAFKVGSIFDDGSVVKDEHLELDPETLEPVSVNPRVKFLDPNKYGGTEEAPPIYIEKRAEQSGWLGILESCMPEPMCEPKVETLFNFDEIKKRINELSDKLEEDDRVGQDPECLSEPPYGKLFSKINNSFLEGIVLATIRIYIVESILKTMPIYTKYAISFPNIMDETYLQYISEKIENGLLQEDTGLFGQKDDKYYLFFLEQAVQIYGRRLDMQEIQSTTAEQNAVGYLNDFQQKYVNLTNEHLVSLRNAENNGILINRINKFDQTGFLRKVINEQFDNFSTVQARFGTSLTKLKKEYRLECIRQTKNIAKILLNSLIKEQIILLSERMKNLLLAPVGPTISDINRHMLSSDITKKDLNNDYFIFPSYKYSYFDVASNLEDTPFKFDETLIDILPNKLNNLIVNGAFFLERYIKLVDKTDQIREEIINRNDNLFNVVNINDFQNFISTLPDDLKQKNISELFGDLTTEIREVNGEQQEVILGTTIGIQYGLRLSYVPSVSEPLLENVNLQNCLSNKAFNVGQYESNTNMKTVIPLVSVEVDLLDQQIGTLDLFNGENSYNYECLLDKLIKDKNYKLLFNYCFPINRFMSLAAITIDNNFMHFIGVDDGWLKPKQQTIVPDEIKFSNSKKAARQIFEMIYNSNQYDYEPQSLKRDRAKLKDTIRGFFYGIKPIDFVGRMSGKNRIVKERPFDKTGELCKEPNEV